MTSLLSELLRQPQFLQLCLIQQDMQTQTHPGHFPLALLKFATMLRTGGESPYLSYVVALIQLTHSMGAGPSGTKG